LLPIGYAICDGQGLSIEVMTLAVTIPSGLAFMLPISSPCNALSYSSGYYSVREAVFVGVFMSAISIVVSLLCMKFYWPLVGFSLLSVDG